MFSMRAWTCVISLTAMMIVGLTICVSSMYLSTWRTSSGSSTCTRSRTYFSTAFMFSPSQRFIGTYQRSVFVSKRLNENRCCSTFDTSIRLNRALSGIAFASMILKLSGDAMAVFMNR